MNVIICVDNKNGIAFNNRRQSRDINLCQELLNLSEGCKLYMTPNSAELFVTLGNVWVAKNPLTVTGPGDYCFIEKQHIGAHLEQMEKLIICRWNRDYPADLHLDVDLSEWNIVESRDIEGNSHEKITLEVYVKC